VAVIRLAFGTAAVITFIGKPSFNSGNRLYSIVFAVLRERHQLYPFFSAATTGGMVRSLLPAPPKASSAAPPSRGSSAAPPPRGQTTAAPPSAVAAWLAAAPASARQWLIAGIAEASAQRANTAAETAAPRAFTKARRLWRKSIRFVAQLLRRREAWAAFGQYLQQPSIKSLVDGLERRRGVLVRTHPGQ